MRSEFLKFTNDSLRKSKVVFVVWDTYADGRRADAQMIELCFSLIQVHLYFMIDGQDHKVHLHQSGGHTFERIRSLGYQYVVCLPPNTLIKCEGSVEELLSQAQQEPEQFCYAYEELHKLSGMILLNLQKCEPEKIDELLKTKRASSLEFEFPCSRVKPPSRVIYSYTAELAAFGLQQVIAQEQATLQEHLQEGFNVCFVFNTESYDDVDKLGCLSRTQHVVGFASGFKLNQIAWKNKETCQRVTFIDLNENSITLKEKMYLQWDGYDLPRWFQTHVDNSSAFYEKTPDHFQKSWERELSLWGGQEKFAEHWRWFRTLPVDFQKIDLLSEPEKLKLILQQRTNTLLWYSNLWNNEYVAHIYGVRQLAQQQLQWLEKTMPSETPVVLLQDPVRIGSKKIHLSGYDSNTVKKILREQLSHF